MAKLKSSSIILILLIILNHHANSQKDSLRINFNVDYVGDLVSNFSGGINQGATYLGMIDLIASFNTKDVGLWKNGNFYLQFEHTHGGTPSADYIGDFQTLSNINNGNYTYLYQFWYNHKINKLSLTLGIHDLNSVFLASDLGGEFINSSFGIMPTTSMNLPVSIFPKTCLAGIIRFDPSDNLSIQAGFYDGDPLDLDTDPHNLNFKIGSGQGMLSIVEVNYLNDKLHGSYKLGALHHNGKYSSLSDSTKSYSNNYAAYFIADQLISTLNEHSDLNVFLKLGLSPKERSEINFFWSFGLHINGLIAKRSDDILGLAIANAFLSSYLTNTSPSTIDKSETAIELMYKLNISDNISVQPEMQYIINPGANSIIGNAFVGLIRTYISL